MPGMSFAYGSKAFVGSCIRDSLESMMHHEDYQESHLLSEKEYFLTCTRYKEYPVRQVASDRWVIYLEGRIYGKDDRQVDKELNVVAEWLSYPLWEKQNICRDWLIDQDGEFIVFVLNKALKSIFWLNDALGRLPIYYSHSADELRVSRELRFFMSGKDRARVDRIGLGQYLLFGYPLGERTLLNNVHRLAPASVMTVNIGQPRIQITQLHNFNCEAKQQSTKTLQANAGALVGLLSDACRHRAQINKEGDPEPRNIVALSGGLDSRTVAACLNRNGIPFTGVTRLDYLKRSSSDSEIAQQLARVLNIDWKLFRVRPPKGEDLLRLLRMKNGLNYLGMAFILSFLDKIREEYGVGITYFTGDGGDKVLRDLRPCWRIKTTDALVDYILSRNQILGVAKVAALTRSSVEEIVGEIREYVMGFPESDLNQKYAHFVLSDRAFKFLFEGEDRNRCFFWSVTPFYSLPFFRYAMACPDQQKERFALHRSVLFALSPDVCSIMYPYWRAPVSGRRYLVYLLIRSFLDRVPPRLKRRFRSLRPCRSRDNHDACLQEQISNSSLLAEYLDEAVLNSITQDCSWGAIKNLLTVTSTIEQLEGKGTSLSKYHDAPFR